MTMIDGTTVLIGGKPYVLPNLNLGRIRQIIPYLQDLPMGGALTDKSMDALIKVGVASLQRNYPEINEDFLLDTLESYEMAAFLAAITEQFEKKSPTAQEVTTILTGTESTSR